MGVKNPVKCSNVLLGAIHLQRGFVKGLLLSSKTVRHMGGSQKCAGPPKKEKKKCRMPLYIPPEYFKRPNPCKTDEELKTERSLGVYMRCDPPYKPLCMGPCFNEPRLDAKLYRPSKTLDKPYKKYWVDCVIERVPKRVCSAMHEKPEIPRRQPRKTSCTSPSTPACRMSLRPMLCRPLQPGPATSETRCIKNPLCECPAARRVTRCKVKPKVQSSARRQLTRYPSFSECQHAPLNPAPITECPKKISICETWRAFKTRHS
ncbi:hypothetical protein ACLKA7_000282 [Drosophila subpalustris]